MQTFLTRGEVVIITVTARVAKQVAISGRRVIVPFPYLLTAFIADFHR